METIKAYSKKNAGYDMVPTGHLSREEWLALRRKGIGGSDAGAICGLNPYASPMSVFQDKVGKAQEKEDNEAMRQGRDLEEYVAKRFCEETGLRVRRSHAMYVNREYPFMLADIDRLVVGEDAGLECKTASAYQADKWKDGSIPAHYAVQCYHYMAVTGKRSWYIAVVILGQGFRYAKLTWDDEIIRNLVLIEKQFWENHVAVGAMPDPDGSKICDEVLEQYFHVSRKGSAVPLTGFDEKLGRRAELQGLIDQLQKEQNQIDQEIKLYMKDCEMAYNDHYRVTWSSVDTTRVDAKRLKEERPEIYKDFSKVVSSRRFTVKAA